MKCVKYMTKSLSFGSSMLSRKCVCGKKIKPRERHLVQEYYDADNKQLNRRFFCCICAVSLFQAYKTMLFKIETQIYGAGGGC